MSKIETVYDLVGKKFNRYCKDTGAIEQETFIEITKGVDLCKKYGLKAKSIENEINYMFVVSKINNKYYVYDPVMNTTGNIVFPKKYVLLGFITNTGNLLNNSNNRSLLLAVENGTLKLFTACRRKEYIYKDV